jgi:hypothetical protein
VIGLTHQIKYYYLVVSSNFHLTFISPSLLDPKIMLEDSKNSFEDLSISQRLELEKMRRLIPKMSRDQLEIELLASLKRELMTQNAAKSIMLANLPKF